MSADTPRRRFQAAAPAPRVTVFIPAFNAADYIGEAIESVLAQSFADFELLIVDDGSVDDTVAVCQHYATDERLRLITRVDNVGRPEVRNEGVRHVRTEYLAFLDADDRCAPDRLAVQVDFLDRHADIDVVGSWWHSIDAQGRRLPAKKNHHHLSPDSIACYLLFRGVIHNPTVMCRKRAIAGFAYDPGFQVAEDYDLWDRMRFCHRMAIIPQRLIDYRNHSTQASTARVRESHARRQDIQARQLRALGVVFDERDLLYHHLLYTGRALFAREAGRTMDRVYVDWAGRWLERLVAANRVQRCYPEPEFSRLAARLWFNVCRKASRHVGIAVWGAWSCSPLAWRLPMTWLGDVRQMVVARWR